MSEGIAKGAIVRYVAKMPPDGIGISRGTITRCSNVSKDGSRAQVSRGHGKAPIWVDVKELELLSKSDPFEAPHEPLPEAKPERFEPEKPMGGRVVLPKQPKAAESPQDRAEPPKAQKAEPMPEGAPAKPQAAFGAFEAGSKMPDGLAWPAIGGEPIPIGTRVSIEIGGTQGGSGQLRTARVTGCSVRNGEQCAVLELGSTFRAMPISKLMPAVGREMSLDMRRDIIKFAASLPSDKAAELMRIIGGER